VVAAAFNSLLAAAFAHVRGAGRNFRSSGPWAGSCPRRSRLMLSVVFGLEAAGCPITLYLSGSTLADR
jgi:hypothetical protein